jgi:signal transduction histidine kinase
MASTTHRILSVYEEELNRIVLDVHDGPVQNLFAVLSILMGMRRDIELHSPPSDALLPKIDQINSLVEASLHEIKFFLGTFRSPEFQKRSISSIMQTLILQHEEWSGQTVHLTLEPLPETTTLPVKIALYRIVQEALSNTYRHAGVEQIWVKFWLEDKWIGIEVRDQGRGFEPPPLEGPDATDRVEHIGLRGMRERIHLLGGTFTVESHPGEGTKIVVKVPSDVE